MSRIRRPLPLLAAVLLAPAISCAALDVDTLLKNLARPAPATTPFVEVRYSKLLDRPLIVKGQLEYREDGALVRVVQTPFRERTQIRGETVSVQREDKPPRRFSLKRAPELRSMLGGFTAVLGGGRAALEQDFNLALAGESQHWNLMLTPKSARVARYIRDILIEGQGNEPRCIIVTQTDKQSSVMLVGMAANATLPTSLERGWFDRFCGSEGE